MVECPQFSPDVWTRHDKQSSRDLTLLQKRRGGHCRCYTVFVWMKLIVISYVSFDIEETTQMTSHVFGNSPSPAITSYSFCKTVEHADPHLKVFVHHNFYVEDGLISLPNVADAIS